MECILTLAGFYCFTIGFSFTYSHTHPASRLSWDQLQTMRGRESNHQPMGNQSHHLNHSCCCCCCKKKPTFPQKTTFQLTSFSSSFFLLSSSISFLRSARWRARASMASERRRESERMTSFSSVQSSDWSCTRFFLRLFILNTNTSAQM